MLDRPVVVGDVIKASYVGNWQIISIEPNRRFGIVRFLGGEDHNYPWSLGYECREFIEAGIWSYVEDDFTRWVREVRQENGSDLRSL